MGQRVTFDDGQYVDFDGDEPISDADLAWAEQQVYGNTPAKPKQKAGLLTGLGTGVMQGVNLLDKGITHAGVGLESIVGHERSPEDLDALYQEQERRAQQRLDFVNPERQELNMMGKIGAIPGSVLGLPGMSSEYGEDVLKAGDASPETLDKARTAVLGGTALNVGAVALPASLGASLPVRALTGAAANVGAGVSTDVMMRGLTDSPEMDAKYDPLNLEQRGIEAGVGALFGMLPGGGRAKPKPTEVNATAARAKQIMEQNKAKAEAPKPVVETPNPDALPTLLPELEAQRAALKPLSETVTAPRLPEAPVEAPLPSIIPDVVPTLPTRKRATAAPETPLPGIDEHLLSERLPGIEVAPLADQPLSAKGARGKQRGGFDMFPKWFKESDPLTFKNPVTLSDGTRLSGFTDKSQTTFHGYDKNGVRVSMRAEYLKPEDIRFSKDSNRTANRLKDQNQAALGEGIVAGSQKFANAVKSGYLKRVSDAGDKSGREVYRAMRPEQDRVQGGDWVTPDKDLAVNVYAGGDSAKVVKDYLPGGDLYEVHPGGWVYAPRGTDISSVVRTGERGKDNIVTIGQDLAAAGIKPAERAAFIKAMKGQSGQVDINGGSIGKIADYITKVRKGKQTTSPLFDNEKKIAAMSKIPGMEMSAYIPKDASWGEVKLDLLKLPDLPDSGFGDLFVGSKEMQAAIKRNPAMYAVGQWFTNARKRAELYDTVAIKPLEREIMKSVRKGEAASVMAVLKEESYAKTRFTPEQLDELLSPSQVEVYGKLRAEFDAALAIQNRALQENGRKPISPHEAYISSRWGGQWRTPVYDITGNVVWWIAEKSKAKAQHALDYIKANESTLGAKDKLDFSRSKVEYKNRSMGSEGKETLSGYREMLNILDEDAPLTKKLQELYEAKLEKEGYQSHGHDKHFEPKGGTKGFHGERPWINDAKDVRDFYESQLSYLRESHIWSELQTAVANTKKMLYDTELQDSHKNTMDWVRQTARNEIGSDTAAWVKGMEHSIAKALGRDPSTATKAISGTKQYFYSSKLGFFNAPFAAMSVIQPVFTIPHHIRLSDQGYKHNPAKTLLDSVAMSSATILPKLGGDIVGKKVGPVPYIPRLYKDAFKYMEANGIVNLNQYSDVGHINRSPEMRVVMDTINYSITAPEKMARTAAFMGYVSHLDQSGKFKGNDIGMFQKAEELTNLSMANFHHNERAPVFNKMGLAGNALVTLKTFKINQLNQLYDFGKGAVKGEGVKPFAAMLGIQITMAGLMGLYGVEQAEWMWKWIKKGLNEAGVYDEGLMDFSPKKWMLENMDSVLSMGAMSQIMGGKDYHSRMDQGTILDPTMAGMMPFVSDLVEQGKDVVTALADPTDEKLARAGYSLVPSALKGAYEMNVPTMTGAPGQGDAFSADRPDEPLYKRTAEDKAARGTPFHGVPTLTEAREKTAAFKRRETEQLRTRQLAIQTEKFNAASRQNDIADMTAAIRKVATLGGNWEALIDGQVAELEKRATTADEKTLLKASDSNATIQTLLKVKRQLEATKKLRENH